MTQQPFNNTNNHTSQGTFNTTMTPNEMWRLTHNFVDIGIDGYEVPKLHYDYHAVKWAQTREDILKNPKKYRAEKKDAEGNIIPPPKRLNFLDDAIKWANSYYDKEKAEEIIEKKADSAHPLFAKPKKDPPGKINYPDRQFFTDLLIRNEKKKYEYADIEGKADAIERVKEKTEEYEKAKKDYWVKVREDYKGKDNDGRWKSNLPKGHRVTVVSEAEHVGEKYPFYNTYRRPDDDEEPKGKRKKNLFYPSVRSLISLENRRMEKSS